MSSLPRAFALLLIASASGLLLAACGEGEDGSGGSASEAALRVVATTTQAADLARNVGGERADVVALLPANADPHDYEVRPRDVEAIAEADVVVRSGGDLDAWLQEAIDSAGNDPQTVDLIDHVATIEGGQEHGGDAHADEEAGHDDGEEHAEEEGDEHAEEEEEAAAAEVDPHWWQDPRNAARAVAALADAFAEADPDGAAAYEENATVYAERLGDLDARIAECMSAIPAEQRKLVTTHDALGYFAERYDIEVIGTVIPSLSSQGQPSAGETAELVETIEREDANAIFTEATVNARVEQAIADEAGAELGEPLLSDTLAPAGQPGDTYLEATALNAERMAAGFTGEPGRCDLGV